MTFDPTEEWSPEKDRRENGFGFFIDTTGYTDRDRLMFMCGFELCLLGQELKAGGKVVRVIHRENTSRVRMALHKSGRVGTITLCDPEDDPRQTWANLEVEPRKETTP